MEQPLPARRGARRTQISGSRAGILGMAVMGEMEGAEIFPRQHQQQAEDEGNAVVEGACRKGGAVNGFMKRREQEDQHRAVEEHGRPYATELPPASAISQPVADRQ